VLGTDNISMLAVMVTQGTRPQITAASPPPTKALGLTPRGPLEVSLEEMPSFDPLVPQTSTGPGPGPSSPFLCKSTKVANEWPIRLSVG
jgi:hypothetical protein